jgi:hypothetical protein
MMEIVVQHCDGCPNWELARHRITAVLPEEAESSLFDEIETLEKAEAVGFWGSPTILLDGVDPFSDPTAPIGQVWRISFTDADHEGAPSEAQLRAVMSPDRPRTPS